MSTTSKQPYKNGYYFNKSITGIILKVEGNIVDVYATGMKLDYPDEEKTICPPGSWTFGDFGLAKEEVTKAAGGIKNYNVQIIAWSGAMNYLGIILEDKETVICWGFANCVETIKYQTPTDLKKLSDDRESIKAPSCSYKIQPKNQGKLVWLSGPPGSGKSTTGQLMGRHANYVYYEADCMMYGLNPFVSLDFENPTIGAFQQPVLKDLSKQYYEDLVTAMFEFQKLAQGNIEDMNWEVTKPFYGNMAKDVGYQKKRIGGNFVVAQAVTSHDMRNE